MLIDALGPDKDLAVAKALLAGDRAFVASRPRAVAAQASTTAVVTRLACALHAHAGLGGLLRVEWSLVEMKEGRDERMRSRWYAQTQTRTKTREKKVLEASRCRCQAERWWGKGRKL